MSTFKQVKVSLRLPFGLGGVEGTWEPDDAERRAAWEMYVELVTRVTIVELRPGEGLLREALRSLYSLFETTRGILRSYGPGIAQPKGEGQYAFGLLAVIVLNRVLRPLLAEWHPRLADWESQRTPGISQAAHEGTWPENAELRAALEQVREPLTVYAGLLAEVADVPLLHDLPTP